MFFHFRVDVGNEILILHCSTFLSHFQVVTGGHYDVDALIMDPQKNVIYKEVKKQYDSHTWKASTTGEYRVCFSNEFSTFSHKLVYMDFQVGDEEPLPGVGEHHTAMTQVIWPIL